MVDSSIMYAITWTVLHFAAMFAVDLTHVTSMEACVKYLIMSFVITNVLLSTVSTHEYFVNKLRYTLYACSVLVPVVYWIIFSIIRYTRPALSIKDVNNQFSELLLAELLSDTQQHTTTRRYFAAKKQPCLSCA